ncbi:MAG: hypothetical protein IJW58_00185 [Clostridia bacterium]|nr:hypothetical protein [Clostridia bacterium]
MIYVKTSSLSLRIHRESALGWEADNSRKRETTLSYRAQNTPFVVRKTESKKRSKQFGN